MAMETYISKFVRYIWCVLLVRLLKVQIAILNKNKQEVKFLTNPDNKTLKVHVEVATEIKTFILTSVHFKFIIIHHCTTSVSENVATDKHARNTEKNMLSAHNVNVVSKV